MTGVGHGARYPTDDPLLTAAEERALGLRRLAGDATAVGELVCRNVRLVIAWVRLEECPPGMAREDLIQGGMLGLMEAANRFDPVEKPGIRFATYATWWVRQGIGVARLNEGPMIRPDRPFLEAVWHRAKGRPLRAKHEEALARERHRAFVGVHDSGLGSVAAPCDDPEAGVDLADDASRLEDAMTSLTDRERLVIRGRWFSWPVRTFEQIGRDLDVCKERVRQIEQEAIARLRRKMGIPRGGRTA